MSADTFIEIGRVIKPKGLRGEMIFDPFVDSLSDFDDVSALFLSSSDSYKLQRITPYKNRAILQLTGIDSIEKAETLRAKTLRAKTSELPKDDGAVYLRDLVGMKVYDSKDETLIGEVIGYYTTAGTVMEVKQVNGKIIDIPYAFAVRNDENNIYINLIEGLI